MIMQQYLLLRHLLQYSKNNIFNEFFITNFLKNKNILGIVNQKNDTFPIISKKDNLNLWDSYKLFQQYNEDQLFLDTLFKKSKYFSLYDTYSKNKKSLGDIPIYENIFINNFTKKIINSPFDLTTYFTNTKTLEDSLIYQNRLNQQLMNLIDGQINNFSKNQYKQQKTLLGVFRRFFHESFYLNLISIIFSLNNLILILLLLLHRLCFIFIIPMLCIFFCNFLLFDSFSTIEVETINSQFSIINFFIDFFFKFFLIQTDFLYFYDNFFNNIFSVCCWLAFYYFLFYLLFFEDYSELFSDDRNSLGLFFFETTNDEIFNYSPEYFFEILLYLNDYDIYNLDNNKLKNFSSDSNSIIELYEKKNDIEHFIYFIFFFLFFIQFFFNTGYWDIDFVEEYDEVDGWFLLIDDNKNLMDYDQATNIFSENSESQLFSFFNFNEESDTIYGVYEFPANVNIFYNDSLDTNYNFFSKILWYAENYESNYINEWPNFDVFYENFFMSYLFFLFNYNILYFLVLLIFFIYIIFYFLVSYIFEIYIQNTKFMNQYLKEIFFLGWSHSIQQEQLKNDNSLFSSFSQRQRTFFKTGNINNDFFFTNILDYLNENNIELDQLDLNNEDFLNKIKLKDPAGNFSKDSDFSENAPAIIATQINDITMNQDFFLFQFFNDKKLLIQSQALYNKIVDFEINEIFFKNFFYMQQKNQQFYYKSFFLQTLLTEDIFKSDTQVINLYNENIDLDGEDILQNNLDNLNFLDSNIFYNYYSGINIYDFFFTNSGFLNVNAPALKNFTKLNSVVKMINYSYLTDKKNTLNFFSLYNKNYLNVHLNEHLNNFYYTYISNPVNINNKKNSGDFFPLLFVPDTDSLNDNEFNDDFLYFNQKEYGLTSYSLKYNTFFINYFFDTLRFSDNFWLNGYGNWIFLNSHPFDNTNGNDSINIDYFTKMEKNKSDGIYSSLENYEDLSTNNSLIFSEWLENDFNKNFFSTIGVKESDDFEADSDNQNGDFNIEEAMGGEASEMFLEDLRIGSQDLYSESMGVDSQIRVTEYLNPIKIFFIILLEIFLIIFFFLFLFILLTTDNFFNYFLFDMYFYPFIDFFLRNGSLLNLFSLVLPFSHIIVEFFIFFLPIFSYSYFELFSPSIIDQGLGYYTHANEYNDYLISSEFYNLSMLQVIQFFSLKFAEIRDNKLLKLFSFFVENFYLIFFNCKTIIILNYTLLISKQILLLNWSFFYINIFYSNIILLMYNYLNLIQIIWNILFYFFYFIIILWRITIIDIIYFFLLITNNSLYFFFNLFILSILNCSTMANFLVIYKYIWLLYLYIDELLYLFFNFFFHFTNYFMKFFLFLMFIVSYFFYSIKIILLNFEIFYQLVLEVFLYKIIIINHIFYKILFLEALSFTLVINFFKLIIFSFLMFFYLLSFYSLYFIKSIINFLKIIILKKIYNSQQNSSLLDLTENFTLFSSNPLKKYLTISDTFSIFFKQYFLSPAAFIENTWLYDTSIDILYILIY